MLVFKKQYVANTIFIDEIQNITGWERFVRRIFDENFKIFITGSNAKLLSSELATHLTGRYYKVEIFPFSFTELLNFKKIDYSTLDTGTMAKILSTFDEYIEKGGFPEYYKVKDDDYFKQVYEDIIYKDLLVRFAIKNTKAFKHLAQYLCSNFTKEINYASLCKTININSLNTAKDYIDHLEESYLLFECHKHDFSLKRQYVSNKKIYIIDNGIRNKVSNRFAPDSGQLLENTVFIELRKKYKDVKFYKSKNNLETDFYCNNSLIQVCWSLQDHQTRQREIKSLLTATKETGIKEGLILTYNEQEIIKIDDKIIRVSPVWQWIFKQTTTMLEL
jgi:hypothetical protein